MENSDYSRYRVLVVDDHNLSQKLIGQQLRLLGFTVIDIALNGEDALRMMEQSPYDIVFLDWSMPVMDGMTFLKLCRADVRYDNIAFVMVSAEAQSSHIMETIKAGATSYITKPLSLPDLTEKIKKVAAWLEKRKSA